MILGQLLSSVSSEQEAKRAHFNPVGICLTSAYGSSIFEFSLQLCSGDELECRWEISRGSLECKTWLAQFFFPARNCNIRTWSKNRVSNTENLPIHLYNACLSITTKNVIGLAVYILKLAQTAHYAITIFE